jgi:hypothetical protein
MPKIPLKIGPQPAAARDKPYIIPLLEQFWAFLFDCSNFSRYSKTEPGGSVCKRALRAAAAAAL